MKIWKRLLVMLMAMALIAAACGDDDSDDDGATGNGGATTTQASGDDSDDADEPGDLSGTIEGAGASFPNPVFQEYQFEYSGSVQPGVTVNYNSIGSGGGIEQFLLQNVDFGSSERYLRDDDLEEAESGRGCPAIQFPVLFGAVTIAFGDEQFADLVLDAETIAAIFQREITNYNDPAIAALNPDFDLPDLEIIPVHRSDGSGTTSVFTTYLDWAAGDGSNDFDGDEASNWTLGSGTEVQWPSGTIGGQGNEGVTAGIQQNEGGLGYVNQAYAIVNDLPTAQIVNSDGNAVSATLEATTEALEVLEVPDSFQFDILGVGGQGFPIVGANWIFTYECGYDENTAEILIDYWTWATQSETAMNLAMDLGYAPLGEGLRARVLDAIELTNSQD
ncbi:MAG: phosphate ABC transporter substrate-binding protein PstS [Acidimicrobiales bacterium]